MKCPSDKSMKTKSVFFALLASGVLFLGPSGVLAETVDIEVPVLIIDDSVDSGDDSGDLDLANVVMSAAKGVTTVQEAPAIITVITGDEIRERGFRNLQEIIDVVPGWMRLNALNSMIPFPITRGTMQGNLFMQNGMSLFGPVFNAPQVWRVQPIENIKRIEMVISGRH